MSRDTQVHFEKFTDRARTIVDLASAEAHRLGHTQTDTVHLLLSMICEGQGIAGVVLSEHSIDADMLIQHYDDFQDTSDATLDEVESRSQLEALWFDHIYPGTEHLLLAVCCLTDSKASRLLKKLVKHPVQLCHDVVEILGHDDKWDRWLIEHPEVN